MADRFMLIPERVYDRLSVAERQLAQLADDEDNVVQACTGDATASTTANNNTGTGNRQQIQILHMQDTPPPAVSKTQQMNERIEQVIEFLPKNYKNKSRLLMHTLRSHLHLEPSNRVRFEDGDVGDNLIDYLRYFTSPTHIVAYEPVMVQKFAQLLMTAAVPQSALGSGRVLSRIASMRSSGARKRRAGRKQQRGGAVPLQLTTAPDNIVTTTNNNQQQPHQQLAPSVGQWTKLFR